MSRFVGRFTEYRHQDKEDVRSYYLGKSRRLEQAHQARSLLHGSSRLRQSFVADEDPQVCSDNDSVNRVAVQVQPVEAPRPPGSLRAQTGFEGDSNPRRSARLAFRNQSGQLQQAEIKVHGGGLISVPDLSPPLPRRSLRLAGKYQKTQKNELY
jgi:hypothetical protein